MQLHQLLKESGRNSLTAQQQLYEQFATPMFLLCRRYVKTDSVAEEVMMTGFLKFFQSLQDFEYINDPATLGWLRRIMVNECLMQLRSSHGFLQVVNDDLPDVAMDEEVLDQMTTDEIFKLITQLPLG